MAVFGQVWLWSVLAFAIGAVLSWLWLARPLRRQVQDLEWQLEEARSSAAARGGAPAPAVPPPGVPGPRGEQPTRWDAGGQPAASSGPATRAAAGRAAAGRAPAAGFPGPGQPPAAAGHPAQAASTQALPGQAPPTRVPPPAAGAPAQRPGRPAPEPDQPPRVFGGVLPPHDTRPTETTAQLGRPGAGADEEPELPVEDTPGAPTGVPVRTAEPDRRTQRPTAPPEPNVAAAGRPPRTTEMEAPPSRISGAFDPGDQVLAPPEVTDGHGWPESNAEHDDVEDVAEDEEAPTSRPPAGAAEPPSAEAERPRSLFEPVVDPEQARRRARPAPGPSQTAEGSSPPAGRAPFGPGSALPQPDGSPPSPEFRVKAFLAGRRYLTADSPDFERTRAQVWFRTATDAQRAGFVAVTPPA
ncbi:sunset domain-containing protein [Gandjariella thermophila]|uniref:Uncharacterized protein n=1 Tax=Gandjariella thermophila TaxID=1931992 RepID=A0A4D4IYT0_9PSEU|nr:hypothetical protein [Gandjariella thermophila]GDY29401.1 hypothetical protein GTS_10340 [Gandjariella thermophila]